MPRVSGTLSAQNYFRKPKHSLNFVKRSSHPVATRKCRCHRFHNHHLSPDSTGRENYLVANRLDCVRPLMVEAASLAAVEFR